MLEEPINHVENLKVSAEDAARAHRVALTISNSIIGVIARDSNKDQNWCEELSDVIQHAVLLATETSPTVDAKGYRNFIDDALSKTPLLTAEEKIRFMKDYTHLEVRSN